MGKIHILVVAFLFTMCVSSYSLAVNPAGDNEYEDHQHINDKQSLELSGWVEDGVRVIEVKASRYQFEPDPIIVKLNELVRLVVSSTDVTHGLAISEFKVNISIPAGKIASVEFIADKKGTFHAYCSVYCGPGHGHMHANFIVQ